MAAPREWLGTVEAEGIAGRQGSSGVEVVFPSDPATPAPLCPHGGCASGFSRAVRREGRRLAWRCFGLLRAPTVFSQIFTFLSFHHRWCRKMPFPGDVVFSLSLRNCHRKSSLWWFWLRGCYILFFPSWLRGELGKGDACYWVNPLSGFWGISLVVLLSFYFKKLGRRIAWIA